ncbi:hypothetical protein [Peloplasma aerotolerans]|uniref:Uncharacterized protein n=1 Tax=Peloplasma aerotolerans TaxID=3044389 RepID=A0AAW6U7F5_9MOLU|nr:hypothetical protein [Mariniplasma sp. M4Ah]MDI6453797.1 hypothetical protein [Mariniplasma sp. M4Ah]MDR4968901.1 hypothetical protein [Acholeplasmataceae bacterium]
MIEEKVGVIKEIVKKKFLSSDTYNIFVTNQRLIFSLLTKDDKKETERRLNEKVKGKSFKERLEIIATHTYELPNRYDKMSLAEILEENSKNFQLGFDEIVKIKVKRPKTKDSNEQIKSDYLVFETTQDKFTITPSSQHTLNLLNQVLGDKAKIPKLIL